MTKDYSPLNLSDENDAWNKMALEISQEIRFGKRKPQASSTTDENTTDPHIKKNDE